MPLANKTSAMNKSRRRPLESVRPSMGMPVASAGRDDDRGGQLRKTTGDGLTANAGLPAKPADVRKILLALVLELSPLGVEFVYVVPGCRHSHRLHQREEAQQEGYDDQADGHAEEARVHFRVRH